MRYWIRELAGWLLAALGLVFFYLSYLFCISHYIFEAWPMAIIGIFVFRGGIHLLTVAVAARICQQVREQEKRAATTKPVKKETLFLTSPERYPPRTSARG